VRGRAEGRWFVGGFRVTRAIRSSSFWLTVAYLGLLLLMARAYA
jgi:hypothetical protein